VDELRLDVDKRVLIINRVVGHDGEYLKEMAEKSGIVVAGLVPQDEMVFAFDLEGKPLMELPDDAKVVQSIFAILDSLSIP
jgi:CO dehydrogenase maturation factor